MFRASVVRAALAAAAILVLTGCSAGPQNVNGRVLLTYVSSGASADALLTGELGVSAVGCVTVADLVLVVPTGSRLNDDGSVDIGGQHFELGDHVKLGGGGGNAPPHSPCGPAMYWWV